MRRGTTPRLGPVGTAAWSIGLAGLVASGAAWSAPQDEYLSRGRHVRVEVVRAAGAGRLPAVVILYGANGYGDGALYMPQARALAERGISAFIVHYFDGMPPAPMGQKAAPAGHPERDRVIADGLDYLRGLPFVDPDRVGLFGISLGGFLALARASKDTRIAAVVDVVGAMPRDYKLSNVKHMPPTLILHGERDRLVPVRHARELAKHLDRIGAHYEIKIYAGEPHSFRAAARADSVLRATDFFVRHLAQPNRSGGVR